MDVKQYMKNRFGKAYFGTTTYSKPSYSTSNYSDSRSFHGPQFGYSGFGTDDDFDREDVLVENAWVMNPVKKYFQNIWAVELWVQYFDAAGNGYQVTDTKDTICDHVKQDMVNVIINGEQRKKHKKKGIWMVFEQFNKLIVREKK